MNSQSIKSDLIAWINSLNDQGVLRSLLIFKRATETPDWADEMTPEARASIERGLEDIREGRTISSREFWEKRGR